MTLRRSVPPQSVFVTHCPFCVSHTLRIPSWSPVAIHRESCEKVATFIIPRSVPHNARGASVSVSYSQKPIFVATERYLVSCENSTSRRNPCPNRAIAPSGSSQVVTSVSSCGLSTGVELVLFSIKMSPLSNGGGDSLILHVEMYCEFNQKN